MCTVHNQPSLSKTLAINYTGLFTLIYVIYVNQFSASMILGIVQVLRSHYDRTFLAFPLSQNNC